MPQTEYSDFATMRKRREQLHEKNIRRGALLRLMKAVSILLQSALFYFVWVAYYAAKMRDAYLWRGNLAVATLYGVVLLLLTRVYRGFEVGNLERLELFASHALSQLITNVIFYVLSFFLCERLVSPLPLLGLQGLEMLLLLLWVHLADAVYWKYTERESLAVFYRDEADLARLAHLDGFLRRFTLMRTVALADYSPRLVGDLAEADTVLLIGVEANVRNGVLKDCVAEGLPAYVLPKTGDILLRGASMELVSGEILLRANRAAPAPEYLACKRAFDVFASLLAIVLTSPVMLVTALAIKCEDGGPVFYRQVRLTKDRREFSILKFRSMRTDAEKDGKARLASENDDRITRVGRFIRACRIDELPQLFNILRGDMTIVGPRPERPEIAAQYEADLPAFALRLQVKAGLTGYAQIYGRYNSEPYEKLQMDLMYINNMSVLEDLKLMFGTVRILFLKESTSGVTNGQMTAQRTAQEGSE